MSIDRVKVRLLKANWEAQLETAGPLFSGTSMVEQIQDTIKALDDLLIRLPIEGQHDHIPQEDYFSVKEEMQRQGAIEALKFVERSSKIVRDAFKITKSDLR